MRRWLLAALVAVMTVGCEEELVLTTMSIAPGDTTIWQDETVTLGVKYFDQHGGPMEAPPGGVDWSTGDISVLSVQDDGAVVPIGYGFGNVTVSAPGDEGQTIRASAAIEVQRVVTLELAAYVTQVNQHPRDPIPLVAGRPGMFRVHALAREYTTYTAPEARVRLWNDDRTIADTILRQAAPEILIEVDQSSFDYSYDIELEGEDVSEGLTASIVMDPNDEERAVKGGDTVSFTVVELDTHKQMLVPVIESHSPNRAVEQWVSRNAGNGDMGTKALTILPVGEQEVEAHAPYETDLNWSEGSVFDSWQGLLRELDALRRQEKNWDHYYYGAIRPSRSGGVGGIAFGIGHPVSCGRDDTEIYIHETGALDEPASRAVRRRGRAGSAIPERHRVPGLVGVRPRHQRTQNTLPVDGLHGLLRADLGKRLSLQPRGAVPAWPGRNREPARIRSRSHRIGVRRRPDGRSGLQAEAPRETGNGGPYLIEGHGPRGQVLFSHRFTPHRPVDLEAGEIFSLAIPAPAGLESITISGPEGSVAVTRESHVPTAILIDGNGEVRAMRRNWDGSNPNNWTVNLSMGLPG